MKTSVHFIYSTVYTASVRFRVKMMKKLFVCIVCIVVVYMLLVNFEVFRHLKIAKTTRVERTHLDECDCSNYTVTKKVGETTKQVDNSRIVSDISNITAHWKKEDIESQNLRKRLPKAIVIGQRKCGTHALSFFLDFHPQVKTATDPIETEFMSNADKFTGGIRSYRDMMPFSFADQITIEKCPQYFEERSAAKRLQTMDKNGILPNIKIIALVCDPVDRALSDFVQEIKLTEQHVKNRHKWKFDEFEKVVFGSADDKIRGDLNIIAGGVYVNFLQSWFELFPKENIVVLNGDELKTDPSPLLNDLEDFIGVSRYFKPSMFVDDGAGGFACFTDPRACLPTSKGRKHPEISQKHRSLLKEYYVESNKRLFTEYVGREFKW